LIVHAIPTIDANRPRATTWSSKRTNGVGTAFVKPIGTGPYTLLVFASDDHLLASPLARIDGIVADSDKTPAADVSIMLSP
jgi:hypothetical protein